MINGKRSSRNPRVLITPALNHRRSAPAFKVEIERCRTVISGLGPRITSSGCGPLVLPVGGRGPQAY